MRRAGPRASYRLVGTPRATFLCATLLFAAASFLMASLGRSRGRDRGAPLAGMAVS